MNVSILLITHNEAINLPRCLDALHWSDDIAIVDSGSTDGTLEIAQGYNARILHRSFDGFASQRNFGLAAAGFRYEWVLHLDADELVTPAFVERLLSLEPRAGIDAYFIPSKTILFDRWLKHAGMYPAYQVRLWARWKPAILSKWGTASRRIFHLIESAFSTNHICTLRFLMAFDVG